MCAKLWLLALLSSLWVGAASAHEVVPAIADMSASDGTLRLELRMNAEAFVAGIDLDSVVETDTAEEMARYEALRALDPAALEAEVRTWAADWPLRVLAAQPAEALEREL